MIVESKITIKININLINHAFEGKLNLEESLQKIKNGDSLNILDSDNMVYLEDELRSVIQRYITDQCSIESNAVDKKINISGVDIELD